jgi:hypothetical protein
VSGSPADTPGRRERRKTVTFDERCDVLEFDRESHEDVVFDDDDGFYSQPDHVSKVCGFQVYRVKTTTNCCVVNYCVVQDDSFESNSSSSSLRSNTPTNYAAQSRQHLSMGVYDAGNDSINGLVDSMLMEANSGNDSDPQTPEFQNRSLPLVKDEDMTIGGDEDGIPHGRMHHAERIRLQQEELYRGDHSRSFEEQPEGYGYDEDELSLSSVIVRSTPPKPLHISSNDSASVEPSTPHTPASTKLPSDVELDEDDIPLGRTHHADRARLAHMQAAGVVVDREVQMLPPSPSPGRRVVPKRSKDSGLTESLVPKFDLGLGAGSPRVELNTSEQRCEYCGSYA